VATAFGCAIIPQFASQLWYNNQSMTLAYGKLYFGIEFNNQHKNGMRMLLKSIKN